MKRFLVLSAMAFMMTGCFGGDSNTAVINQDGDFTVSLPMAEGDPLLLVLPSEWKQVNMDDRTVIFAANAPTGETLIIMDQLGNAGTATEDIMTQAAQDFFYFERNGDTTFQGKLTVQHPLRYYTTRVMPVTNKRFVYASCSSAQEVSQTCKSLVNSLAFAEVAE